MSTPVIDFRSDTVTRPSPGMRQAMAQAEVGDDVYGEDPTVRRLEELVAELAGTEAALFVPSGTMANQIAIKIQTRPGDEILAGKDAHNWLFESGGAAAISGVQVLVLPGDGRFTAADVRAAVRPDDAHRPVTRMVSVENTHNMAGGVLWERGQLTGVIAAARELGLASHLDGARLWNAAAAQGLPERELTRGFDTVSVCLSKGLGAPVGSLLCTSRELRRQAHRARKMLGGGMRQAGILAAAGLYALEHNRPRLAEDHDNARFLARALAAVPGVSLDVERVHTNIIMVDLERASAPAVATQLAKEGVRASALSPTRLRLVTHLDVDRAMCERAAGILAGTIERAGQAA